MSKHQRQKGVKCYRQFHVDMQIRQIVILSVEFFSFQGICLLFYPAVIKMYCYQHIFFPVVHNVMLIRLFSLFRSRFFIPMYSNFQISMVMIGCFLICWSPYAFISLWAALVAPPPAWLSPFPTFFCKASCALNPIIYTLTNSTFRNALMTQCSRRLQRVGDRQIEVQQNRK